MLRIMTLSSAAWDDTNSLGNTYSNLFTAYNSAEFTSIYSRSAMPNNNICREYYRITEKSLMKNLFSPSRIGDRFSVNVKQEVQGLGENRDTNQETGLIALVHKYKLNSVIYALQDFLWSIKGWQNKQYEDYIAERDPNVVFSFAIPTVQLYLQLLHLKQATNASIVLFLVDNVCGEYISSNGKKGRAKARRLREMLASADKVYAISEELRTVYANAFHVNIDLLRKGCDFSLPVKEQVGNPVRLVYAGNLLYKRIEILEQLGRQIAEINGEQQKLILDIYSGTTLSEKEQERLNVSNGAVFHGRRPFAEIRKILSQADIVLHVESFEKKQIEYVKYSFSTKITDALESGSAFMVIGPKGIASVEYPRTIPGVIVVDEMTNLQNALEELINHSEELPIRARKIREYAIEHHSSDLVHKQLWGDLTAMCSQNGESIG